ncbi:MAG: tetratricopeptide repeat protein [Ardenticatenaceae bacterium]|nr:tetratricopeptide repeat protein [Ardenticatenaceae bacterium]MCB9444942.1 tetratricopeptide repeat protein [Ardenticatenaceae bacterium]
MTDLNPIHKNLEEIWNLLMSSEKLMNLPYTQSMEYLGQLIDLSLDLRRDEGLARAQTWAGNLATQELMSQQRALLHYFSSNIWANIAHLRNAVTQVGVKEDKSIVEIDIWDWEQEETEKQIFHLRAALGEDGFNELPETRRCQIYTNLANLYNTVGRFVEAIEYWGRAIAINPLFGMALAHCVNIGWDTSYSEFSVEFEGEEEHHDTKEWRETQQKWHRCRQPA